MKRISLSCIFLLFLTFGPLLAQKFDVSLTSGHTSFIRWLEYSNDDKFFITAAEDNMAKLWDASTGREIRVFNGHMDWVTFAYAHTAKGILVTGSMDGYALVWDINTGEILKRFDPPQSAEYGLNNIIESGDLSKDGRYLAVGHRGGQVFVYDLEMGEKYSKIPIAEYRINVIRFAPDGNSLLVACGGSIVKSNVGSLERFDFRTGERIKKYRIAPGEFHALTFDQTMRFIALNTSSMPLIEIFKAEGGISRKFNWEGNHHTPCEQLYFAPDGNELYAMSKAMDYINVYSTSTGKILRKIELPGEQMENCALSGNGKFLAVADRKNYIYILDPQTGKLIYNPRSLTVSANSFDINSKNNLLAIGGSDGKVYLFDYYNLKFITSYTARSVAITSVSIHPDAKYLAFSDKYDYNNGGSNVYVVDLQTGKTVNQISNGNEVGQVVFSPDGKNFAYNNNAGYYGDFLSPKDKLIKMEGAAETSLSFTSDGKKILGADGKNGRLYNAGDKTSLWTTDRIWVHANAISPDQKYIANVGSKKLIELKKLKGIYTSDEILLKAKSRNFTFTYAVSFSPDSKTLVTGHNDLTIRVWDVETGLEKMVLKGHNSAVTHVKVSGDGKFIFSAAKDGSVRMWDMITGKELLAFSVFGNNQWAMYSPDGYWDGTPQIGEVVSLARKTSIWPIDQFASQLNRPDILLKSVGNKNQQLISHYEKQYQKRLRKLQIAEGNDINTMHVPQNILLANEQNGKMLKLKIQFKDSVQELATYNIFVNNVPVFGAFGKAINGSQAEVVENIELQTGENKVEFSCTNNKGGESMRNVMVFYNKETTSPDLYLLAFGVSQYQNAGLNLQFAHKDAIDLEKVVQNLRGKSFGNVYTKVLTNEQVTPDAIKASKDFVKNAKVDDTFILFIAGHGMHDKDAEATYYYLTSNADINNLKGTAADFETIEDLLQGIPPRNKLFLMDACESGEIDDETYENLTGFENLSGLGIASRGFKSTSTPTTNNQQQSTKRSYLYQKDRYIYNDLVRRSGAIVFSSSKGGELSYERSDIENGLFTEYIMKALITTEADKDGNGTVSTDELRIYVTEQVAKASGDLQHPTVDRDNIYQKFGFQMK